MAKQFVRNADGSVSEVEVLTKTEAAELTRIPLIKKALFELSGAKDELAGWLYTNKDKLDAAFGSGTVRRVTKAERKALEKALDHVAEVLANDIKADFVVSNKEAIFETFKWPNQKRVAPEEKAAAVLEALLDVTDGNEKLSTWLVANEEGLAIAYTAGVVKRPVSQEMLDRLAAGRAKVAATREAAKGKK